MEKNITDKTLKEKINTQNQKYIKENYMKNIEKYYTNTESEMPRNNIKYFINKIQCDPSNAIELGCGAGNDTVYLIKNNWNVLAIDKEDVEERISKFFGINDEWNKNKSGIIFHKKEEIIKLFSDLDIVKFKEIEKDMLTGMGKNKHWHIFDVIAKKK